MGERGFDGFDVAGAEKFGGEDVGGVGAGFPSIDDLGGGEGAGENRHTVAFAKRDDVRAQGGGDDEFSAGEDAGARGLGIEDGAEAEEKIGQLGLETTRLGAQAETAAPTPTLQLVGRAIMADLGLFLGKTCIVLLVIAGIGVAAAVRVSPLLSGLPPTMSISMTDVADKASMMVRDVQAMPHESKESLRQNVGILSRELSPIIEAWRTPPAPEGKTDPVSPAPATSPRR